MKNQFSLKNKVAVITGAARGNGLAITKALLNAGAYVYMVDVLKKELKASAQSLRQKQVKWVIADLSNRIEIQKLILILEKKERRIDILVNNAGISLSEPSDTYSEENWDNTLNINLKTPFLLSQAIVRSLMKADGSII